MHQLTQRSSTPPWDDDAEEDAFSSGSVDKVEASTSEKLTTSDILAKIKARQAKPA
jgi:hypothetical protein